MYDVYVNNNNKKKLIIIGGAVIGVILIGFFVFFLLSGDGKEKNLKDFYAKINNQKYDEMYAMISDDAKSTYTKEAFIKRNKNIYDGMEVTDINIDVVSTDGDKITYTVNMKTVAGSTEFENTTQFKDDKIIWNDSFIYPDLGSTDKVRIVEDKAQRGRILDRNGTVLAGKGEAYSVGLVRGKLNGENDYDKIAKLLDLTKEGIQKTMSASWIKDDSFVPLKTISKDDKNLENDLLAIAGVKLTTTNIRS